MAVLALILGAVLAVVLAGWAIAAVKRRNRRRLQVERLRLELLTTEVLRIDARRRKRLRWELALHADLVRSVSELVDGIDAPPEGTPQARLKQTALVLASEDRAVVTLAHEIRNLWPPLTQRAEESDSDVLKPLDQFVDLLGRNSVKVAGAEQVFLTLLSLPSAHSEGLSVAIQHLGGVLPDGLRGAADSLLQAAHAAQLGDAFHGLAGEILQGVAHELGKGFVEHGPSFLDAFTLSNPEEAAGLIVMGAGTGLGIGASKQALQAALNAPLVEHHLQAVGQLTHIGGLEGLSHVGVLEGVSSAHFPVITMLVSLHREVRLLEHHKTSFDIAAKNLVLDVAGTGGGAAAGAAAGMATGTKIGLVAGTVLPGLGHAVGAGAGAAIGAVAGAIGGAMAGRAGSNKIKTEPFRKAKQELEHQELVYPERIHTLQVTLWKAVSEQAEGGRTAFLHAIGRPRPINKARSSEWRTVAINLRNATQNESVEARAAVTAGWHWAAGDQGLAMQLAKVGSALDTVDTAMRTSDERLQAGDYVDSMVALTSAPIRLPATTCALQVEELTPLVAERRRVVAQWTVDATRHFNQGLQIFEDAVAPDYRAYQTGHEEADAAIRTAESAFKVQADDLGVKY